eukprot:5342756-Pleurochrysis_carterae.AAC.1
MSTCLQRRARVRARARACERACERRCECECVRAHGYACRGARTENVDGEDAQAALDLDGHDGEHALVEDGVARVLGRLRVGRDLRVCARANGSGEARERGAG